MTQEEMTNLVGKSILIKTTNSKFSHSTLLSEPAVIPEKIVIMQASPNNKAFEYKRGDSRYCHWVEESEFKNWELIDIL